MCIPGPAPVARYPLHHTGTKLAPAMQVRIGQEHLPYSLVDWAKGNRVVIKVDERETVI
jgi:hypothetical protein